MATTLGIRPGKVTKHFVTRTNFVAFDLDSLHSTPLYLNKNDFCGVSLGLIYLLDNLKLIYAYLRREFNLRPLNSGMDIDY